MDVPCEERTQAGPTKPGVEGRRAVAHVDFPPVRASRKFDLTELLVYVVAVGQESLFRVYVQNQDVSAFLDQEWSGSVALKPQCLLGDADVDEDAEPEGLG